MSDERRFWRAATRFKLLFLSFFFCLSVDKDRCLARGATALPKRRSFSCSEWFFWPLLHLLCSISPWKTSIVGIQTFQETSDDWIFLFATILAISIVLVVSKIYFKKRNIHIWSMSQSSFGSILIINDPVEIHLQQLPLYRYGFSRRHIFVSPWRLHFWFHHYKPINDEGVSRGSRRSAAFRRCTRRLTEVVLVWNQNWIRQRNRSHRKQTRTALFTALLGDVR